ncbi:MAG: glycosyltransferase family 4 protein [Proteobacteria bacterium]|nr:glycosyltransferase family 4 protein [Pseudomonadota bacterium]
MGTKLIVAGDRVTLTRTVLHVLSQRPLLTGSGVTLDAFVRRAAKRGWEQHVVVGVPAEEQNPLVGELPRERIHPVFFGVDDFDFPVPGMSDVMPYVSTRFSAMNENQLVAYKNTWRRHLRDVIATVSPDIIHSHHIWLVSSLIRKVAPDTPIVTQCHATGFRQMELCPHLAEQVKTRCRRNDRFLVLHAGHADQVSQKLSVKSNRISIIGAGFDENLFHGRQRGPSPSGRLIYVGKLSRAKGLPWLLDAVEKMISKNIEIELHVAGSGSGSEAEEIEKRLAKMAPRVIYHGRLDQAELAVLMRTCSVCVLPSFYEGVPLVLVEAFACGCRIVSTRLPGVMSELAPHLGDALELVPLPRLIGADVPNPGDLPAFVDDLALAIEHATSKSNTNAFGSSHQNTLKPFTWDAVFSRVEEIWYELMKNK